MNLIIGLGNPGRGYANNRHNTGFACVNYFAKTQGIHFDKKQGQARIGTGEIAGKKVVLARPQTYMNLSGESVSRLVKKLNVSLSELLVIHDDLDIPLGRVRIRQGGGSGGHKGVESIIACLGSEDFIRLRIGIGRPTANENSFEPGETDIAGYVLSNFTDNQKQAITDLMPMISEAILCLVTDGLTVAMNRFNHGS